MKLTARVGLVYQAERESCCTDDERIEYCEAHCKGGVVGISGREGGAKECQSFCQVPITLDFLPTPNQPDPDLKPKSTAQGFSQNGHIFEILP